MNRRLYLILLASGGSTRYGANKLLETVDGKPMFRHILDLLVKCRAENPGNVRVTVVSRYGEILDAARREGCIAVRNDRTEEGISLSLRMGLEAALREEAGNAAAGNGADDIGVRARDAGADGKTAEGECAVFFTADQPYLSYDTLKGFLGRAAETEKGILTASNGGSPGNPVSFDRKYFEELMTLKGDTGGRRIAGRHPEDTEAFEMSQRELTDIDTPVVL